MNETSETQSVAPDRDTLLMSLFEALNLCVQSAWAAEGDGTMIFANQRMCEQARQSLEQMRGKHLSDLEWGARLLANNPDLFGDMLGDAPVEGILGGRGGYTDGWERIVFKAVRDGSGELLAVVGVHSDHEVEEEVPGEVITMGDPSFGAPWIILVERLQQAIERASRKGKKMAVLYLELKGLQEACGTAPGLGDAVLDGVVERIKKRLRRVDTIALIDQEEFVVVLEDLATPDNLLVIGERLLEEFSAPLEGRGERYGVSLSIGASCFPIHGEDPDALLDSARQALTRAKAAGQGARFALEPPV